MFWREDLKTWSLEAYASLQVNKGKLWLRWQSVSSVTVHWLPWIWLFPGSLYINHLFLKIFLYPILFWHPRPVQTWGKTASPRACEDRQELTREHSFSRQAKHPLYRARTPRHDFPCPNLLRARHRTPRGLPSSPKPTDINQAWQS